MAACRIVNADLVNAVAEIKGYSDAYRAAGESFIESFNSAIAEMEGAAKDALKKFIDTDVKTFIVDDLPNAVEGMSKLLEANRENFETVDQQIADNIGG